MGVGRLRKFRFGVQVYRLYNPYMARPDYQPFDYTRQFLMALCTPTETPGISKQVRDRAAVCLKEVWDCTVRDAVRVSTGPTGNQWFTIPDPPEKQP